MKIYKKEKGQVALIMVLVMTVVAAMAVSLAARSTTGTKIQQTSVEADQAYLAAQAALEQALTSNQTIPTTTLFGGTNFQATMTKSGSAGLSIGNEVKVGETIEASTSGATASSVDIYWNPTNAGDNPALLVSEFTDSKIVEHAFDTSNSGIHANNHFTYVTTGGSLQGVNYAYKTNVALSSGTQALRITVLYAPAQIGFAGNGAGGLLPDQRVDVQAVGSVAVGTSVVQQGLQYSQSVSESVPSVFDYVLFSNGNIAQ